jgi:hypothetical protein
MASASSSSTQPSAAAQSSTNALPPAPTPTFVQQGIGGTPTPGGEPFDVYVKCERLWRRELKEIKIVYGTTVAQVKLNLSQLFPELGPVASFWLKYAGEPLPDTHIFDNSALSTKVMSTIIVMHTPQPPPTRVLIAAAIANQSESLPSLC